MQVTREPELPSSLMHLYARVSGWVARGPLEDVIAHVQYLLYKACGPMQGTPVHGDALDVPGYQQAEYVAPANPERCATGMLVSSMTSGRTWMAIDGELAAEGRNWPASRIFGV